MNELMKRVVLHYFLVIMMLYQLQLYLFIFSLRVKIFPYRKDVG